MGRTITPNPLKMEHAATSEPWQCRRRNYTKKRQKAMLAQVRILNSNQNFTYTVACEEYKTVNF